MQGRSQEFKTNKHQIVTKQKPSLAKKKKLVTLTQIHNHFSLHSHTHFQLDQGPHNTNTIKQILKHVLNHSTQATPQSTIKCHVDNTRTTITKRAIYTQHTHSQNHIVTHTTNSPNQLLWHARTHTDRGNLGNTSRNLIGLQNVVL